MFLRTPNPRTGQSWRGGSRRSATYDQWETFEHEQGGETYLYRVERSEIRSVMLSDSAARWRFPISLDLSLFEQEF
jgi:hypothetical protein